MGSRRHRGARRTPSQLGYKGFPAAVCTSRNDVVCHGIPSAAERLEPGDIVNVDVTTCIAGYHGDTSATFFVGAPSPEARHVVEVARRCRDAGISVVRDGARIGDIGAKISSLRRARAARSCASSAVTASDAPCTWTRRSPTQPAPAKAGDFAPAWSSPSSP